MSKRLLRIVTFGLLGVTVHTLSVMGQEQGEEILIPVVKHEYTSQDSVTSSDFGVEHKAETRSESTTPTNNLKLIPSDSHAIPADKFAGEKKGDSTKVIKKEDNQSNLSFNFLYYIFYKFKPSEVFEKK